MARQKSNGRLPISYSRGTLFERCPARFEAEYMHRGWGKGGPALGRPLHLTTGTFMHEVVDQYTKHLVAHKVQTDYEQIDAIFEACWRNPDIRQEIPESAKEELLEVLMKCRESISIKPEEVVGSEVSIGLDFEFNVVRFDDPTAWVRMKIDRLEADANWNILVWDLKTGYRIDDAEKAMQLKVYGLAAKLMLKKAQTITVRLFYARPQIEKTHVMTDADFDAAKSWLRGISDQIEAARWSGRWEARPGTSCADCPIFDRCPARVVAASLVPPTNMLEAENLMMQYILVERQKDDIKKKLETWVELNGPLEVGGFMCGYAPSRRIEFPLEKLEPVLVARGLDIKKFLKADNDELKKAAKKDPSLQPALDAIMIDKSYSKFQMTKVKG